MGDVTNLAEFSDDARLWAPEQMLMEALHEIRSGNRTERKAVLLMLDDSGDEYHITFYQAGMLMREAVLLCEMGKDLFKDYV